MPSTTPPAGHTETAGAGIPSLTTAKAEERNKRVAVQVVTDLFEKGDVVVADRHLRADYLQHNPGVPDGRKGTKDFVRELRVRYPGLAYNIKRVLAQGALVMVHANPVYEPGTRGVAVIDIFRFDENGMIAEHWDTTQEVPATTVNGNDMFGTISNPRTNQPSGPHRQTPVSERVVTSYFHTLLVDKNPDAVEYLTPEFYQHNPAVPSGSAGLREQLAGFFQQFPDVLVDLKRVVAERDYVAIHFYHRLTAEDRGQSVMGIFRVENQKIIEHWDVIQGIPLTSANDNTMF